VTARGTFAVFMQPNVEEKLGTPKGVTADQVAVGQFAEGQDFGAFSKATIDFYYRDSK